MGPWELEMEATSQEWFFLSICYIESPTTASLGLGPFRRPQAYQTAESVRIRLVFSVVTVAGVLHDERKRRSKEPLLGRRAGETKQLITVIVKSKSCRPSLASSAPGISRAADKLLEAEVVKVEPRG